MKTTEEQQAAQHDEEHEYWSRRNFIKSLGLTGTGLMLGGNIAAMPLSRLSRALSGTVSDRILVLIRLDGGNDGLNTFIPLFDYGTYSSLRPNLALPQNGLYDLGQGISMHAQMGAAYNMWQSGMMKVIQGVGYENHNQSHFRSTDIWDTASDPSVFLESGWLGRKLEEEYPDFDTNPPEIPAAIKIGSNGDMLFNNAAGTDMSFSVANPEQLLEVAENGYIYNNVDVPDCYYGEQLQYLRTIANSIYSYAEEINTAYTASSNAMVANYPTTGLGPQLSLVARLIKGNLGTKLYLVSLGTFDTHANQLNNHATLLQNLAESVEAFYMDLATSQQDSDVLSMTVSEFGRRVAQNASQGTDHGMAAPLMMFGPALAGNGLIGDHPSLTDLNNGNLKHGIDFRQVYASVLKDWLCLAEDRVEDVLGGTYTPLSLGFDCTLTAHHQPSTVTHPSMQIRYGTAQVKLHYRLPENQVATLKIYSLGGQLLYQEEIGTATENLIPLPTQQLSSGLYVCTLQQGTELMSKKFVIK